MTFYDDGSNQYRSGPSMQNAGSYCSHCGSPINPEAVICVNCGCSIKKPVSVNTSNTLLLSVITSLCCCTPLGLIAMYYTLTAASASTQAEADKRIRSADYANIFAIVMGFLILLSAAFADTTY